MRRDSQFRSLVSVATSAVFVLVLSASVAQAQLVDGGFESGTVVPGGVGGWEPFNGAAFTTDAAHSGSYSMGMITTNNVPGAFQAVPANAGDVFTLTGYVMSPTAFADGTAFGGIQISYFDIGGTDLGTVETGAGTAAGSFIGNGQAAFTPGEWTFLSVSATAPAGTVKVQAFPIMIEFTGAEEGIYADDLVLTPEPASLSLLALAGLLIRRR